MDRLPIGKDSRLGKAESYDQAINHRKPEKRADSSENRESKEIGRIPSELGESRVGKEDGINDKIPKCDKENTSD